MHAPLQIVKIMYAHLNADIVNVVRLIEDHNALLLQLPGHHV